MDDAQESEKDANKTVHDSAEAEEVTIDEFAEEEITMEIVHSFAEEVSKPKVSGTFTLPTSPPVLALVESLGFDSCRRSNLHVLDEDTLLFVAGSYLVLHRMSTQTNSFLRCTGGDFISCVAVHPERTFFGAGERAESPNINVFTFPSCELHRVLSKGTVNEYVSITFDPYTGELLASQGGEPDFYITIWKWREETPLLRCKSFSQDVYHIDFNETLYGYLVTSGLGHIRFWRMAQTFTGLKLKGLTGRFGTQSSTNIEAAIPLPDGKVLSGSVEGRLLLWEEALLVAQFKRRHADTCHDGQVRQMFMLDGEVLTLGEDGYIRTWNTDNIRFVQPSYSGEVFLLRPMQEVLVSKEASLMYMTKENPEDTEDPLWYVQAREGMVWRVDLSIPQTSLSVKEILSFHGGPVLACAPSPLTHLVATAGHDGTLRIFDCLQKVQVLCMPFSSPGSSLAWLPVSVDNTGESVILGFQDGIIRRVTIFVKTHLKHKEKSDIEGKLTQVFKAHRNKVTSLTFSPDGNTLASASSDGTIFLFFMDGTQFKPHGWFRVPTGVRQLVWTPAEFFHQTLLAACEEGIVLQLRLVDLRAAKVTANFHMIMDTQMSAFKFLSVKSELQHAEKLARQEEEKLKAKGKRAKAQAAEQTEEDTSQTSDEDEEGGEEEEGGEDKKERKKHKRKKKEEEEHWEPFIPETPSPILRAVYSKRENHFWLSMGGYDAGYLYLCTFPDQHRFEEGADLQTFLTKPVQALVVPDCSDSPVTVVTVDEELGVALFGFSNGHIRVVQLSEDKDLHNVGAYWDLGAHTNSSGGLTSVDFAFDHSFVVSTGMDGNIFLFNYRGYLDRMKGMTCTFPPSTRREIAGIDDLPSDTLWFPDQIDKDAQDIVTEKAEKAKKKRRDVLKELQLQLKSVLFANEHLPPQHRFCRQDLLANVNCEEEFKVKLQNHLAKLHKKYAWQTEKTRLLLAKTRLGWLRHEELPHQITVKAFDSPRQVTSFRVPAPCPELKELCKTFTTNQTVETPLEESGGGGDGKEESRDTLNISNEEFWLNAYKFTRQRSTLIKGSAARTLVLALNKAEKAARKRAQRHAEWEKLYQEKLLITKEKPEDLQVIEIAKNTIGDLKLKTHFENAAEMAQTYSSEVVSRDITGIEQCILDKVSLFNEKVTRIRKEKQRILDVFDALNTRLCKLSCDTQTVPNLPQLSQEEVPESRFAYDDKNLSVFENKFGITMDDHDLRKLSSTKRDKSRVAKTIHQHHHHHTYYMGERSEFPHIVRQFLDQNTEKKTDMYPSDPVFIGVEPDTEDSTPFRQEINTISKMQLDFEEEMTICIINDMKSDFDRKLVDLQREKFDLEVFIKRAELVYLAKVENLLVDLSTRDEQTGLSEEQMTKKEQLQKNNASCIQLKKQIAKKTEEGEDYGKKLTDLWMEFQTVCSDKKGSRDMRFLTMLYKRKAKKLKVVGPVDSESEASSTESSISMLESGSGTVSSMSVDLDYCPETVDAELYHLVLELQLRRQQLDEVSNTIKQDLAALNKDLEQKLKDNDSLQKALQQVDERFLQFWKRKIKLLNEIEAVVPITEDQIRAKVEDCLVLERQQLKRLYHRVFELKDDIHTQAEIMEEHRKEHMALRRGRRLLREQMTALSAHCDEEMIKKFGRLVDLRKLQLMVMNPKREMLTCDLLISKQVQQEEMEKVEAEIDRQKLLLREVLKESTLRHLDMVHLASVKLQLDRRLDKTCIQTTTKDLIPYRPETTEDRDQIGLGILLKQQASVINDCWHEIHSLQSQTQARLAGQSLPPLPPRSASQGLSLARRSPFLNLRKF